MLGLYSVCDGCVTAVLIAENDSLNLHGSFRPRITTRTDAPIATRLPEIRSGTTTRGTQPPDPLAVEISFLSSGTDLRWNRRLPSGGESALTFAKRMKILISSLLLALAIPTLHAELPAEAGDLLSKLASWEIDQQVELQKRIQEKRAEVSKFLERIVEERTKTGDLDGALAVKAKIEELTTAAYGSKDHSTDDSESSMEDSNEFNPANTTWIGSKGPMEGWEFDFSENGEMAAKRPDGKTFRRWTWKIDEAGEFYIKGAADRDEFRRAEINKDRKEFEWNLGDDVDLTEFEPKNQAGEQDESLKP